MNDNNKPETEALPLDKAAEFGIMSNDPHEQALGRLLATDIGHLYEAFIKSEGLRGTTPPDIAFCMMQFHASMLGSVIAFSISQEDFPQYLEKICALNTDITKEHSKRIFECMNGVKL